MDVVPGAPFVCSSMELEGESDLGRVSGCVGNFQDNHQCSKLQDQALRVLRKRPVKTIIITIPKRRFPVKPKKVVVDSKDNKNSENFYFGGKFTSFKKKPLETIYEEPIAKKDGTVKYSGSAKLRRLNFSSITKSKIKKRKIKIKAVFGGKYLKKQKMSVDDFIAKLKGAYAASESEEIATLLTNCEIK